jgi:hypothetical protein
MAPYREDTPRGAAVDPQRLVQRTVKRGTVAAELSPELLLPLGVGEHRRVANGPLHLGGVAGAGRRGLDTVPLAPRHHVALAPPHEGPLLRLRGERGEARPLIPPGRRGVVVRDLHHHRPGAAGRRQPLCCLRRHRRFRLRSRGRLTWRRDHRLWPHLRGHGRPAALLSRHRPLCLRRGRRRCDNPPRKVPYYRLRPIHFGR